MNTRVLENCVDTEVLQKTNETAWESTEWSFKYPKNSPYEKRHAKINLIQSGKEISQDSYLLSLVREIHNQIHARHLLGETEIKGAGISLKDSAFLENIHKDPAPGHGFKLLGLLNPIWKEEWGGGFKHNDTVYEMKPGNFVLFDPLVSHAADKILCDEKRIAIDYYEEEREARLDFYK